MDGISGGDYVYSTQIGIYWGTYQNGQIGTIGPAPQDLAAQQVLQVGASVYGNGDIWSGCYANNIAFYEYHLGRRFQIVDDGLSYWIRLNVINTNYNMITSDLQNTDSTHLIGRSKRIRISLTNVFPNPAELALMSTSGLSLINMMKRIARLESGEKEAEKVPLPMKSKLIVKGYPKTNVKRVDFLPKRLQKLFTSSAVKAAPKEIEEEGKEQVSLEAFQKKRHRYTSISDLIPNKVPEEETKWVKVPNDPKELGDIEDLRKEIDKVYEKYQKPAVKDVASTPKAKVEIRSPTAPAAPRSTSLK